MERIFVSVLSAPFIAAFAMLSCTAAWSADVDTKYDSRDNCNAIIETGINVAVQNEV